MLDEDLRARFERIHELLELTEDCQDMNTLTWAVRELASIVKEKLNAMS